jgi:ubiquinone/menaquinone biosynthesis C-methylase UbiE
MAGWWDRKVVPHLIRCACGQPAVMKARAAVVPLAQGDVFELGCGGGINLPLYDAARIRSFSGCDPSPELLAYTRQQAQGCGLHGDIREGAGEAIPFADASFDTVVTTFTLCSVQQPEQVLAEIRRVLRPGGTALFLEHGRAPDAPVRRWQARIEPLWKRIAGGCHLTRPVAQAYRDAGFATEPMGQRYMPKTPKSLGWIEWGLARG